MLLIIAKSYRRQRVLVMNDFGRRRLSRRRLIEGCLVGSIDMRTELFAGSFLRMTAAVLVAVKPGLLEMPLDGGAIQFDTETCIFVSSGL